MHVNTRLQKIRQARGISAADLARRTGVTRQTVYSIEAGSFVPNTAVALQLARALDVTVEEIFSIPGETPAESIRACRLGGDQAPNPGELVRFCHVGPRLLAVPVPSIPAYLPRADGVIESATNKRTASVTSPLDLPENGKRLLLAGCDPALSLLNQSPQSSGIEILAVPSSSRRALAWLKQGRVHAAGSHLFDRATGEYNLPVIRRLFPSAAVSVVTFAVWEQGLLARRGNPKNIRSIADLGRKNVTLINREKGSGSRDLLDAGLREAGISAQRLKGYDAIASGHLAAAYAVAAGSADCCIAPRSAARRFGLDFIPVAAERFDLAFSRASLDSPAAKALLDLLNRSHLRKKLQLIAGYDTAHTGEVLL